jgi:hypothetical protein
MEEAEKLQAERLSKAWTFGLSPELAALVWIQTQSTREYI